jgi:hypothetical protein
MNTDSSISPSVSDVVWPWRKPKPGFVRPPVWRVMLQVCLPYAIASYFYFISEWEHGKFVAIAVTCSGTLLMLLGIFLPKAFVKLEKFLFFIVYLVGIALSWICLIPLYFTFFLIAHFFLWIRRKDPMLRKLDPSAESYWTLHKPVTDPQTHYRRQF